MSFGIWKNIMTTSKDDDMEMVTDLMVKGEFSQDHMIVDQDHRGSR